MARTIGEKLERKGFGERPRVGRKGKRGTAGSVMNQHY